MSPPYVVVLGGGIAGLSAAYRLQQGGARVTLVEADERTGGKLRTGSVAGVSLDVGADAFLARVPEALDLVTELGLTSELVTPATLDARVWTRGRLRRLPSGHVLGIPTSLTSLAASRAVSPSGVARASLDRVLPRRPSADDVGVGELVGRRLGREVVDRLVDPMLGGVYAGQADAVSAEAAVPQLAAVAHARGSLLRGLRSARRESRREVGPVFHSLRGGTGQLAGALASRLDDVLTRTRVALVERLGRGWRVTLSGGRALIVDGVVVALPAAESARLLRPVDAALAGSLDEVAYADVAIVALAYPRATALPRISGLLVPAVERRTVKAVTLTTTKWPHLDVGEHTLIRCSVGRLGEPPPDDDGKLVDAVARDVREILKVEAAPVDAVVTRWAPGLPQYTVGHLDRAGARDALLSAHPTLALAGAAYEGVGIPACIRSGARAAARVLDGTMPA